MSEKKAHTDTQMFRVLVGSTVMLILDRKANARRIHFDVPPEAPLVYISPNRSSLTTLNGRMIHPWRGLQNWKLGPDEDLFAISLGVTGTPVHMTVEDKIAEGYTTDSVDKPSEAQSGGERAEDEESPSGRPGSTPSARGL